MLKLPQLTHFSVKKQQSFVDGLEPHLHTTDLFCEMHSSNTTRYIFRALDHIHGKDLSHIKNLYFEAHNELQLMKFQIKERKPEHK